ncbi:MAG: hypothetical protein AAB255_01105 [Bacteroidota bacterium]
MFQKIEKKPFTGILTFIFVLFVMPLGHTLMILMQNIGGEKFQFLLAGFLGFFGIAILFFSLNKKESPASFFGFISAIFVWTGWIEFAFVYFSQKLNIQIQHFPDGEMTKPEYLLLPSSIGLLGTLFFYFLFNKQSGCNFFVWITKYILRQNIEPINRKRNIALITFVETIYLLWFFYILLLILYDNSFFGVEHFVTKFFCVLFFVWSIYLFIKLIKFAIFGSALRYAIPTVIIFWSGIEILGRLQILKEFWLLPFEYFTEITFLSISLLFLIYFIHKSYLKEV